MLEIMRVEKLSPETIEKISHYRYDILIEKQELWPWESMLHEPAYVEFLNIEGFNVLLPVEKENHPNISVLRFLVSDDKQSLTIFLMDTTHYTGSDAGVVAVCDKVPGEDWYIAVIYHACRLVTSQTLIGEKEWGTIHEHW